MTHADLVLAAAGVHTGILTASIAAYYKYGDRTELFTQSLGGTDDTLRKLRHQVATELADAIAPLLAASPNVSLVLDATAQSYTERPGNPLASEQYRERVRDFVERDGGKMVDCCDLIRSRESWCAWARFLSWTLLVLVVWETVLLGILLLLDRVAEQSSPEWTIRWAALPTAILILLSLLPLPALMRKHDRISNIRMRNDSL